MLKFFSVVLLLAVSVRGDAKADLATSETRVGPHFYGGISHIGAPLQGYVTPVVQPALYSGHYGPQALAYGAGEKNSFVIHFV